MVVSAMPSPWLAVEAGTDLLARARQIQRSWDRLLGGGALGPDLPPEATAGLRPTILESWRRSLDTGLDPTELLPPIEADPSEVQQRWLEHPLGSIAHVLEAQFGALAEETDSLVVVTDASGLLLHTDGGEWLKDAAREMNFCEGALFSDMAAGTNGVGTALAADHALQVFAFEHFNQLHSQWTCSAAPVHDPVSGRIVGLIDLTSPWKVAAMSRRIFSPISLVSPYGLVAAVAASSRIGSVSGLPYTVALELKTMRLTSCARIALASVSRPPMLLP